MGRTKNAVTPEIIPVIMPITGFSFFSLVTGTRNLLPLRLKLAYRIKSKPNIATRRLTLIPTINVDPRKAPVKSQIIRSQNLRKINFKAVPNNACQILVMTAGKTRIPIAWPKGSHNAINPMLTVGSPIPIPPLTTPASKKIRETNKRSKFSNSNMSQFRTPYSMFWTE